MGWTIGVLGFGSQWWLGSFCLHYCIQNGSGAHPSSYPMGTRSSFPWGKVTGVWSWPLTSI